MIDRVKVASEAAHVPGLELVEEANVGPKPFDSGSCG